jgi:hypothetical protein
MASDDLVTDGALAKRAGLLSTAAQGLYDILLPRKHLADARTATLEGMASLRTAQGHIEECSQDDPDQVGYRSRVRKESFPTASGVWFFPFDPKPEEVRHDDIVAGLVNTCRYNGQVPRFLSVAEHSIKVAAMAEHLVMLDVRAGKIAEEYAFQAALHALLHDAHEAYLGDIISPIKRCIMHVMGDPWEVIESRVQDAIMLAYYLGPPTPEVAAAVNLADQYALYCEALVLKSNSDLDRWGLRVPPPDVQAVGAVRREEPDRAKVRDLFDGEVRRLVQTLGGLVPEDAHSRRVVEPPPQMTDAERDASRRREASLEAGRTTSPGSWRNKIASSSVDIPSNLMNEPEFLP